MNYKKMGLLACVWGVLSSLDVYADSSIHCPSFGTINKNLTPGATFWDQGVEWRNASQYEVPKSGKPPIPPVKLSAKVSLLPDAYGHLRCLYIESERYVAVATDLPKYDSRNNELIISSSVNRQDCPANPSGCIVRFSYGAGRR